MRNKNSQSQRTKKPFYKRWWFWVLAVCVLFFAIPTTDNKDASVDDDSSIVEEREVADTREVPVLPAEPEYTEIEDPSDLVLLTDDEAVMDTIENTDDTPDGISETNDPTDAPDVDEPVVEASAALDVPEVSEVPDASDVSNSPDISNVPEVPDTTTDTSVVPPSTEESISTDASEPDTPVVVTSPESPSESSAPNPGSDNSENFDLYNIPEQQQTAATYVLNTNTMKFHYPHCNSVAKIKPENYAESWATRDELISQGYSPCGNCHP